MIIIIIIICILIFWLIVTHKYKCKTAELLSEVQLFLRKLQDPQKLNVISFVYLVGPTMNVSWTFVSDWCDTNEQIVRNSRRLQALGIMSLHSGPFFVQHCKHNGFHNLCKLHVIQNKLHMLQVFTEAISYQYWSKQSTSHTSCSLPVIAAVHNIRVTSSITFEWPINHTKSACFTQTTILQYL